MFKSKDSTLSNPTSNGKLNQINNENLAKCSGTVSSIQRRWTTAEPSQQVPSSSLPSWQADESDWPPSPPRKTTTSISTTPISKSQQGDAKPLHSYLYNSNKSSSITNNSSKTNISNNQSNLIKKHPLTLKRQFPWDTPDKVASKRSSNTSIHKLSSEGTRSSIFGQSHLSNPKMSIAAKVTLSPEQQAVLDHVISGKSVFFTGSAGTGKSVLLRHIISALRRQYDSKTDAVAVTASTGMAACAIGGTTIHCFAGIGLGNESQEKLLSRVRRNRKASGKWMRVKALIIDEVSMLDGELFDKLAYIAQNMKKSDKPFGGIQLVIAGDFFQLPPVSKGKVLFAFNAEKWLESVQHTVNLTQVFRQKDTTFIDMLNEMRTGNLSQASIQKFRQLSRELKFNDGIVPTELYPTRYEVERSNSSRLDAIKEEAVIFEAHDSGKSTPEQRKRDLDNMMAVSRLVLKKGAQVMMIKNQSSEEGPTWMVNGLVGQVEDFVDNHTTLEAYHSREINKTLKDDFFSSDEDNDEKSFQSRSYNGQPPLRGEAKKNLEKSNSNGGSNPKNRFLLPVVRWHLPNGKKEVTIVEKAEFKVENQEGEIQSRRVQIPLILAWAMSIHKSQGQTLNRVKVDLGKVFEKGQIYVALSRATSLEGLQVLRFDHRKVMAHPEVIRWSTENLISNL